MSPEAGYFETRFEADPRREVLWRCLNDYFFSRYIRPEHCVLELGCGYGHFLNNVRARRRIGVDRWPEFPKHLRPGVEGRVGDVTDLAFLADGSVDFALASNLLEHLSPEDGRRLLDDVRRALAPGGLLALLQPNYRYAYREYFDDYTHVTVYSDVGLSDLLRARGYAIVKCVPRFMPLTLKSRFKVSPALIWLYLHVPVKPLGKQMLILARPAAGRPGLPG
jgi:SAM-dependent methyltransferase